LTANFSVAYSFLVEVSMSRSLPNQRFFRTAAVVATVDMHITLVIGIFAG